MVWEEKAECKTCGGEWPESELADGICCNCQPAYDLGRQSRQDEIVAMAKAQSAHYVGHWEPPSAAVALSRLIDAIEKGAK